MKGYVYLIAIILGFVSGCGKDCTDPNNPECSNYDPCYGKQETSADFYTEVKYGGRYFEVDVANSGTMWRFRAKDTTADEYLWEIGADIFNTKEVFLKNFPYKVSVPIKLTVMRNNPNVKCFPNDKGTDTKVKNILTESTGDFLNDYFKGTGPKNLTTKTIYGKFRGSNKRSIGRVFTMELKPYCCNYRTDEKRGADGRIMQFEYPDFDLVNIPYEGVSLYKCFETKEPWWTITSRGPVIYVDGIPNIDDNYEPAGGIEADHLSLRHEEKYKDSVNSSKYYSFFKSYFYLDRKDKDKITIEYWYRDTITRKILKDTFVGTRIN